MKQFKSLKLQWLEHSNQEPSTLVLATGTIHDGYAVQRIEAEGSISKLQVILKKRNKNLIWDVLNHKLRYEGSSSTLSGLPDWMLQRYECRLETPVE